MAWGAQKTQVSQQLTDQTQGLARTFLIKPPPQLAPLAPLEGDRGWLGPFTVPRSISIRKVKSEPLAVFMSQGASHFS